MTTQTRRLQKAAAQWVHKPLVDAGFQSVAKKKRWVYRNPVSTVVRLWTRRDPDALRFTLEWGFFSPEFARAMNFGSDPDTLTAALRAPIGSLLGDGRLDVWWAIAGDGTVHREAGLHRSAIDFDRDSELSDALKQRLVPLAHTVTNVTELLNRSEELTRLLQTAHADEDRTLALLRTSAGGDSRGAQARGEHERSDVLSIPAVLVEPQPDALIVSFDDVIAHHHADVVQKCVEYCSSLEGASHVEWSDREFIIVQGLELDFLKLQDELSRLVSATLAEQEDGDNCDN